MHCVITQQLETVVEHIQREKKTPKDYGTGEPLYHSEIRFLRMIEAHPMLKMSEFADQMCITRSAATQHIAKLSAKRMIEIYQQDSNKKEKYLRLTPLAEKAIRGHEKFHADTNANLCSYFRSLDDSQRDTIKDFLSKLDENTSFCDFVCKNDLLCTEEGK